jgi:hypothetical protein
LVRCSQFCSMWARFPFEASASHSSSDLCSRSSWRKPAHLATESNHPRSGTSHLGC